MNARSTTQDKKAELKFRVSSPEDLDKIAQASAAKHSMTARQVNVFFDTDALDLNKERYTVRLRRENDIYELGAKSPGITDAQGIKTEIDEQEERPFEPQLARKILEGEADPLDTLVKVRPNAPGACR